MTNAERQGKDIVAQMCETGDWAVNKNTGEIMKCYGNCHICKFYESYDCADAKVKWLNAEYEPKREFSEGDRAVLRALEKVQWVAIDDDGLVFGYLVKPKKGVSCWSSNSYEESICISNFCTSAQFLPISWDDDEPTSRKKILGEE